MKMGWKSLVAAGAVLVLLSSLVMAQSTKGDPGKDTGSDKPAVKAETKTPGDPGGWIPVLAWWLDLTKEQVAQMNAVVEEARVEIKEGAEVIAAAQAALHEAVAGGAGEEEIRVAATALGTVIGDQAVLHAQTLASLKAVLTKEQLKDFDKIKTKLPQLAQLMHKAKSTGPSEKPSKSQPKDETGKTPIDKKGAGDKVPADDKAAALMKIFKAADANKDGMLTMKELQAFLGAGKGDQPAPKKEKGI